MAYVDDDREADWTARRNEMHERETERSSTHMKRLRLKKDTLRTLGTNALVQAAGDSQNPNLDSCAPTFCLSDLTCLTCTCRPAV